MENLIGNYKKYTCKIKDTTGAFITNLEDALEIAVELKLMKTQEQPDISKFLTSGDVVITNPLEGEIEWEFNSLDSKDLTPGLYNLGIQIEFSPEKRFEIKLNDINLKDASSYMLKQDIVRH